MEPKGNDVADELLPCPFDFGTCDKECLEVVVETDSSQRPGIFHGYVKCCDCGSRGPEAWADEEGIRGLAIYGWNDRARLSRPSTATGDGSLESIAVRAAIAGHWRSPPAGLEPRGCPTPGACSCPGESTAFYDRAPTVAELSERIVELERMLASRPSTAEAVAVRFMCDGCGRVAVDPAADLAKMRAAGALSCCPERKILPLYTHPIGETVPADGPADAQGRVVQPKNVAELEAWQYRYKQDNAGTSWGGWGERNATLASYSDYVEEKRPLYSHPIGETGGTDELVEWQWRTIDSWVSVPTTVEDPEKYARAIAGNLGRVRAIVPLSALTSLRAERDAARASEALWDAAFVDRIVAEHGTTIDILSKRLNEYAARIDVAESSLAAEKLKVADLTAISEAAVASLEQRVVALVEMQERLELTVSVERQKIEYRDRLLARADEQAATDRQRVAALVGHRQQTVEAILDAETWLEAVVADASPNTEESTHEVVKTITKLKAARAALATEA